MEDKLTHFDEEGRSRMVDVSAKPDTLRTAIARGRVIMQPETLRRIMDRQIEKGNVFEVARVAAIMGAKKTAELIPMCHPIFTTSVDIYFNTDIENSCVEIEAKATTVGKTGIEMEAVTAVSIAGLTIYDMCKAIDRSMVIDDVRLVYKAGGKSGEFCRDGEEVQNVR